MNNRSNGTGTRVAGKFEREERRENDTLGVEVGKNWHWHSYSEGIGRRKEKKKNEDLGREGEAMRL